jgi:hypothetical protein
MPKQSHQISSTLTLNGVPGASSSLIVDGSVTPVTFAYTPRIVNPGPSQELFQLDIERLTMTIVLDGKLPDDASAHYGVGDVLPNGLTLQYRSTTLFGQPERLTPAADAITSNLGWISGGGFDEIYQLASFPQTESLDQVRCFPRSTILYPGAKIEIVVNDDLTLDARKIEIHSIGIVGTESLFIPPA